MDQVMREHQPFVLVLNGPNLNLLGRREPGIYGSTTLEQIIDDLRSRAAERGLAVVALQSNHEGVLVDAIQEYGWEASGIIINPGALTHYSIAVRDALSAVPALCVEIHISNIAAREPFRHHSVISAVVAGTIAGLGPAGYRLAFEYLADRVGSTQQSAT